MTLQRSSKRQFSREKEAREALRQQADAELMLRELMHDCFDLYQNFLFERVKINKLTAFIERAVLDDNSQDEYTDLGTPGWKVHANYGTVFTVQTSNDYYFKHDEKLVDGIMDEKYLRKKTNINMDDSIEGELSKKQQIQKMLADNSLVAFTAKGNHSLTNSPKINVDFLIAFNSNMRLTVLAEGEGPFASELSNFSCRRIIGLFESRYKQEKGLIGIEIIMKHAIQDLQKEISEDNPSRPFDTVFSGVASRRRSNL